MTEKDDSEEFTMLENKKKSTSEGNWGLISICKKILVVGTAGFFISVFNLMNAILGSGILGLSYAMAQLGIILFTVICGGVAALALYAIHLLLEMCKITGAKVTILKTFICLSNY